MAVPFSNTKIRVPAGFRNILEGFAREVLRDQPHDIYAYGSIYFDRLMQIRAESGYDPAVVGAKEEDYLYNTESFKRAALEAQSRMDNEAAALRIQTKYRQYTAKKAVMGMRQNKAAVKIQAVFRGHRDRKFYRGARHMSLSETEQATQAAHAEDAEECEREGDSPHGIYITDIPDRNVSGTRREISECDLRQGDTADDLPPVAAEAEAEVAEETKAGGSEEAQEEEKKEESKEGEDEVISDLEDAAARIQAGMRGVMARMTLKSGKLIDSEPGADEEEVEEEEVEEEKDEAGLDSTVVREPSGTSPEAVVGENTEEVKQEPPSEEKKEEQPVEEEK